ncbi:MAG: hypothetical protein KAG66_22265, partial [Methylococcales bacterium]|nr:hypothetical protein [Methylococcales bacterium]
MPADNNYGCFSEGTGYAYNWSNGSTTEDLSGIGAGRYMVTVTDGAGCTSTSTQVVAEPPQIVYTVATSPTDTICQGDSVSITSSNAAYTYTYSPAAILTNTSGLSTVAFPNSSAAVQIIAEDSNNCFDTSSVQITVNALPTAMVSGMDTICTGDSTTLTASGGTSYNWTSGDMTPATTVSPASSQSYTVTVTDSNGCSDDSSVAVVVNALPVIAFSGDSSLCLGDTTTLTASGGGSYAWSTFDTTAAITVSPTADLTYTLVVTDVNACQSSDSIVVTVHALPIAAISGDSVICAGDTANLLASGGGSYLWNTSEFSAGIGVAPLANTTYSVVV